MNASKTLILFASRYGQTEKIAQFIADHLRRAQTSVHVVPLSSADSIHMDEYNSILIGGSVYAGKTDRKLRRWVRANVVRMNQKPNGLFLVNLNSADPRPEARKADLQLIQAFCAETSMAPQISQCLKGALPYRRYSFFIRFIMKRISKKAGGPTDTSKDYELTDWDEVRKFAETFKNQLPTSAAPKQKLMDNPGLQ